MNCPPMGEKKKERDELDISICMTKKILKNCIYIIFSLCKLVQKI